MASRQTPLEHISPPSTTSILIICPLQITNERMVEGDANLQISEFLPEKQIIVLNKIGKKGRVNQQKSGAGDFQEGLK